jgi:hypothetical protein
VYVTVGTDHDSHFGYPEDTIDASASSATTPPTPVCG